MCATDGDHVFIVGGETSSFSHGHTAEPRGFSSWESASKHVVRFSIETSCYTALPDMPEALDSPSAALVSGKLFVCGGVIDDEETSCYSDAAAWNQHVYVLDVQRRNRKWQRIAGLLCPRKAPGCVVIDELIFVGGGIGPKDGEGLFTPCPVEVYNSATLRWMNPPSSSLWAGCNNVVGPVAA